MSPRAGVQRRRGASSGRRMEEASRGAIPRDCTEYYGSKEWQRIKTGGPLWLQ